MDSAINVPSPTRELRGGYLRSLKRLGLFATLVVLWQVASTFLLDETTRNILPAPTKVVVAAWELVQSGELIRHLRDSVRRELTAFLWAALAIPLGIAMAWWKPIGEQVDTVVEILRPIPPLAWIPLSILWFGIGETQNVFIIFLGMVFPILVSTVAGVKNIQPGLIRAARCLGAGERQILWRIVLRASLPEIFTGIRVGLGVGWMALVAAELVGASTGLGFLINDARTVLRTDYVIVGMATIGAAGLTIDASIRALMKKYMPWYQATR